MKLACFVIASFVLATQAHAQSIDPATVQLWDVVHTSDGSVLKGVIVEEVPGSQLRIVIVGGTSLVVEMAKVTRFTKELNPTYAGVRPAGNYVSAQATSPARVGSSGVRIGVTPGFAQHFAGDEDVSTFFLGMHAGYELALEQWGLTPGVVVDYTPGAGANDTDGLGLHVGTRAAYRGSSISPFVGFGIGLDYVGSDTSFGTFMGAGIELLLHRRVALSAEAKFHRGWASYYYTKTLSYGAFGMGVEIRL
jgi:hypothetical protein